MAGESGITTILAHELQRLCEQGIVISPEILFYAESTYGLGPADIESALRDSDFEAHEELLALVLTPDIQMRRTLEPLLEPESTLGPDDLKTLVFSLGQRITAFHLVIPETTTFDLPVEQSDLEYFVTKCYFDRGIDPILGKVLEEFLKPETTIACRLVLRCRGDVYAGRKRDFLCRFVEKSRSHEDQYVELFTLMVTLLAQIKDEDPIEECLLGRRRHLVKTLRDIREFEQKREHYSMEYLMMQRYPIPHESEEQVLAQLQMVMTITDSILELPPDPSLGAYFRDLGVHGRRAGLSEIIRKLS